VAEVGNGGACPGDAGHGLGVQGARARGLGARGARIRGTSWAGHAGPCRRASSWRMGRSFLPQWITCPTGRRGDPQITNNFLLLTNAKLNSPKLYRTTKVSPKTINNLVFGITSQGAERWSVYGTSSARWRQLMDSGFSQRPVLRVWRTPAKQATRLRVHPCTCFQPNPKNTLQWCTQSTFCSKFKSTMMDTVDLI
jgi:hypothetical protein